MSREAKTKAWFEMKERIHIGVVGIDLGSPRGDHTVFTIREPSGFMHWKTVSSNAPAPPFRGTGPMLNFQRNASGIFELP